MGIGAVVVLAIVLIALAWFFLPSRSSGEVVRKERPDVDGVYCGPEEKVRMIDRDQLEAAAAPVAWDEEPFAVIRTALTRLERRELGMRGALQAREEDETDG